MAAVVFAAIVLGAVLSGVAIIRGRGRQLAGASDGPARLLDGVVACLSGRRAEWGAAMRGELAQLTNRHERWRFALGCTWACALAPPSQVTGRRLRAAVITAATGCAALVGYGLLHYPGLRTGNGTWFAVLAFLCVLVLYVLVTSIAVRDLSPGDPALGVGLAGGVAVSGIWLVIGALTSYAPHLRLGKWLLLAVPLICVAVGFIGSRRDASVRSGCRSAVLAAVVGGLLLFLVWVGDTLASGGRPYDPGMLRDFAASGAPDLTTYAVSDNMGAGMGLLVMVPLVMTALGSLGAALGRRRPPQVSAGRATSA